MLDSWHEPLALVYVDGKHGYWSVLRYRAAPCGGRALRAHRLRGPL
ncbi:hypothetical protein [Nocardioides houyundeii]|nr:hypothetical protein [Nocardioides houyundeii]